jgi:hypothetical protein
MPAPPRLLGFVLSFAVLAALVPACTAELAEDCLGGPCVPPGNPPIPPPWPPPESDGGSDGPTCEDTTDTGDFPCDVFALLQTHCHTCHQSPPLNSAPFPLLTFEDTQAPYGTMGKQRWQRMAEVVESGFMPLGKTIPPEDKQALLAWLTACAPPTEAGMGCE